MQKLAICNPENVSAGNCNETHLGEYIVSANVNKESHNIVHTQVVDLKDPKPFNYPIKNTGYYCIFTAEYTRSDYEAIVEFRNAFGELPAAQIPKLPFYGGITILYALVAVFWGLLYYRHRSDILPVQNYITAILIFLVVEMLLTWAFYDYLNRHGSNTLSKFLLVLVAVLNAIRNSFSFFLLLIVCMGYGVVKHTLGKTMIYVRYLAIAHFFFGLVYAVASLVITPDSAGEYSNIEDFIPTWLLRIMSSHTSDVSSILRSICVVDCPTTGWNTHCFLRMDAQLAQLDAQGVE